jgi:hypothetical protein
MLQQWHRRGDMPESLSARMPAGLEFSSNTLSIEQLGHLTGVAPIWLFHCRPQSVAVLGPEACELETLLRFGGHFLYELARTQAELARTQAALNQICNSRAWRMTAPLRRGVVALREIAAIPRAGWKRFRRWLKPRTRLLASGSGR